MTEHTPGPWRWEFNGKGKCVALCGGRNPFDLIVVDFVRWGMSQAMPRFRTGEDHLNIMVRADKFLKPVDGREHHAAWFQNIDHPDANLIASSPDLLAACEAVLQIGIATEHPVEWSQVVNAVAKARGVK